MPHPASWWEAREGREIARLPLTASAKEAMEWEALSLNVARHPLLPYREALRDLSAVPSTRIKALPHGSVARAAGLMECLQSPPTKSGRPVYFLIIEDEAGLLQTTLFADAYERFGHLLHGEGAFLLEGRVERTSSRGFGFLVQSVRSLGRLLADVPMPRVSPSPGAFLRVGRRGRKAG
jgi:error-prone DNA polymerase